MEKELIHIGPLAEFIPKTSFSFISKGKLVNVPFCEITHISKYGNETVIYTTSLNPSEGRICYRTFHNLHEILDDLPVNDFYRIHKAHIISLRFMNGVKRKRIKVREYYLPISNYYKSELVMRLARILDEGFINMGMRL